MMVFLVAWKCWRKEVLNYCQLETVLAGMDLNNLLASPVRVTTKTLHFANLKTRCSSMRSLK